MIPWARWLPSAAACEDMITGLPAAASRFPCSVLEAYVG